MIPKNKYGKSYKGMGKALDRFREYLKKTPEDNQTRREMLTGKIELLKICRIEMKQLFKDLS